MRIYLTENLFIFYFSISRDEMMVLESQLCNERKEKNRILKEIQEKEEELEKRRKERMEEMEKELKEMEEMEKKLEDMEEKNQLETMEKVFIKYYFTEF